jgi:hypothetical protein
MRFSVTDLILHTGVFSCASLLGGLLAGSGASAILAVGSTAVLATAGVLGLLPPLYRRQRLLPLRLPPCPHCRQTPSGYQVVEGAWPSPGVRCGGCGGGLWLVFDRNELPSELSAERPALVLQWPENLGFWKTMP